MSYPTYWTALNLKRTTRDDICPFDVLISFARQTRGTEGAHILLRAVGHLQYLNSPFPLAVYRNYKAGKGSTAASEYEALEVKLRRKGVVGW